jgi:hypothetical protein
VVVAGFIHELREVQVKPGFCQCHPPVSLPCSTESTCSQSWSSQIRAASRISLATSPLRGEAGPRAVAADSPDRAAKRALDQLHIAKNLASTRLSGFFASLSVRQTIGHFPALPVRLSLLLFNFSQHFSIRL